MIVEVNKLGSGTDRVEVIGATEVRASDIYEKSKFDGQLKQFDFKVDGTEPDQEDPKLEHKNTLTLMKNVKGG